MLNIEVRQKILQYYYDRLLENSGAYYKCDHFIEEWNVSKNLIELNVAYLYEKRFLKGNPPMRKIEGRYKLSAFGLDTIENPEQYVRNYTFLQVFLGDVSGSTIIQTGQISFEENYHNAVRQIETMNVSADIMKTVEDIKDEAGRKEPDLNKFRTLLKKLKTDDKVHSLIAPIIADLISKILLG